MSLSLALDAVWQIAASEARQTQHQQIEPEHLLIALCKLEDTRAIDYLRRIAPDDGRVDQARVEIAALNQLLAGAGLHPSATWRELRKALSPAIRQELFGAPRALHRSAESRQVFGHADDLARQSGATTTSIMHLLLALLDRSNVGIAPWLAARGVDVARLRQNALASIDISPHTDDVSPLIVPPPATRSILPPHSPNSIAGPPTAVPSPVPPAPHATKPSISAHTGPSIRASAGIVHYSIDLVQLARDGVIQPVFERDDTMLQIVRVLSRATKNIPLLVGDSGVGKTAVIEGLAWRIAQDRVPGSIRGISIIHIAVAALTTDVSDYDELAHRISTLLNATHCILFLDGLHVLPPHFKPWDITTVLRPVLARGRIRCIASMTSESYRELIAHDASLDQFFQPVVITEPTIDQTLQILRHIRPRFAALHQVDIADEALQAVVQYAGAYARHRRFPEKAIDLLDEVCVHTRIQQLSMFEDASLPHIPVVTAANVAVVAAEWSSTRGALE